MQATLGEGAPSYSVVKKWDAGFKVGERHDCMTANVLQTNILVLYYSLITNNSNICICGSVHTIAKTESN